ncbi:MAG TPA: T9SS type A sorting domain-containing protein [Saprospiraceae bacterium]|nr:T9SS type A sorting domain-containing protein [Saprospiraceae bacterium]
MTISTSHGYYFVGLLLLCFFTECKNDSSIPGSENEGKSEYPDEWMYRQRAFPNAYINHKVYDAAIIQARLLKQIQNRSLGSPWTSVGPVNIGGRITDIALHPTNQNVLYVGASNGGVFKSEDGGLTWRHIYDNDGRLSIGNIELSVSDPDILYIGTGEANGSYSSGAFYGNGLYRSDDAGETWTPLGLPESHHIGRIVLDPQDPYHVFVAATGYLYGKNTTRGIYRSFDGGEHWEQALFVSDSTSAIDIAIDPLYPDTLYASFWERLRYPEVRDYAGLTSGIYRSFDGGDTWEHITNGLPVHEDVGRIGLAVAPSSSGIVYASIAENPITNDFAGLYKSIDAGSSWSRIDDQTLEAVEIYAGFGWYFGNVRVDPVNPDIVYVLGLTTWQSPDGGVSWNQLTSGGVHVDHHAMEIHPQNQDFLVLGTDGGVYISRDGGFAWEHVETLPVTELYTCEIDQTLPFRYYGGAQDNGTMRTLTGNQDDWERIFGGDGFYVIVDPVDNNIIYCEYQWGNLYKTTNDGVDWAFSKDGINGFDRNNWNTPIVMSPHNRNRLYYGTHRLYTSDDGAENWTRISDDLTNTSPESPGGKDYGALSTIAVAPSDSNVIYTGSEDGYVFVTFDHGNQWNHISDNLPERYITRVAVDPYDAMVAYVTLSGYRELDYLPHLYRTPDGGETWEDISGNLPEVPLNDIIIDPELPATLYVASDLGVWYTDDLGIAWYPLGEDLPMTAYSDLTFHAEERKLLAASFGLSMWVYDLGGPVSVVPSVTHDGIDLHILPNPIRELATIRFELKKAESLEIIVYDITGRLVSRIASHAFTTGAHALDWWPDLEPGMYVISVSGSAGMTSRIVELF